MSRDFLLLVFHESVSSKPLIIPIGPFRIFSRIRGDFRSSRLATGVVYTGGKFATDVVDASGRYHGLNNASETGGKICRRWRWYRWQNCRRDSLLPVAILPPVSLTPVANLPPVSLIPVVHLDWRVSPRIFEKIRNGLNGILWGWGGNWFIKKTDSKKYLVTLSL